MPDVLLRKLVPKAKPSKKVVMSKNEREEKAKPSKTVIRPSTKFVPKQPPEFPPAHLMQHAPSDCLKLYIERRYGCYTVATKLMLRLLIRRGACDEIPRVLQQQFIVSRAFFNVDVADPDMDESVREYCMGKRLRIPGIKRMQPFARQRRPLPNKPDNYLSVEKRVLHKLWHPKGHAPKATQTLSEDFHFMMRCLHGYLPSPAVPTKSSKSEDRFVQQYGMQFGTFAINGRYTRFLDGEQRLPKDQGFDALHAWLTEKVICKPDPFGWKAYSLTPTKIKEVSSKATKDWQDGRH